MKNKIKNNWQGFCLLIISTRLLSERFEANTTPDSFIIGTGTKGMHFI